MRIDKRAAALVRPIPGQSHWCEGLGDTCTQVVRNDSDHCESGHENRVVNTVVRDVSTGLDALSRSEECDNLSPVKRIPVRISGNPGSTAREVFATLTLDEPTEHTVHYEVAAWSTTVRVGPGTYNVTTNGYYAFVSLPGIVVSSYTPSLYDGMPIDSQQPQGKRHHGVGLPRNVPIQEYLYDALGAIAKREGVFVEGKLTLAKGYEIRPRELPSPSFTEPGKTLTHHDLYRL